jgi:hypothetical protein|tara:strand:- start:208 stop:663 length:456 start_codon:yes stop_codon:yes gene_type:complete
MPEAIPTADIYNELDGYGSWAGWVAGNVTKPVLIEQTGAQTIQTTRIDLNRGDYVIVKSGSPSFKEDPIGNWQYVNRTSAVSVNIQTKVSRQRLYDLMAEIRRIAHVRRHSMTNYQRLQFVTFTESIDSEVNVWVGTVELELINNAVLAET